MACSPGGRFSRSSCMTTPPDFSSHNMMVPTLLPCASCILTLVLAKLAVASVRNRERARAVVVFMHGIIEQLRAMSFELPARSNASEGFRLIQTGSMDVFLIAAHDRFVVG